MRLFYDEYQDYRSRNPGFRYGDWGYYFLEEFEALPADLAPEEKPEGTSPT